MKTVHGERFSHEIRHEVPDRGILQVDRGSAPLPIPYREIILTSRIMDRIFEQIYPPKRYSRWQ